MKSKKMTKPKDHVDLLVKVRKETLTEDQINQLRALGETNKDFEFEETAGLLIYKLPLL